MTATSPDAAQFARAPEADLEQYPEDRGEILIEAANAWHRAGEHDQAIDLLRRATQLGGEDGGNGRVALADVLFSLNRADEAEAQLAALRHDRPNSAMPYHLAGELLEDRGDHQAALTWFNMAVSRLTEQDRAHLDELGAFSYANNVLAGRRRVRRVLGMPADNLDESVMEYDRSPFTRLANAADASADGKSAPQQVRVLFWPRSEIPRAHERWPQWVEYDDADAIVQDREQGNRELSEAGVPRITMVPLTVAALITFAERTGCDPMEETTRRACMDQIVAEGGAISWPPARNAACWCGSGVKYKKCCGRPILG